VKPLRICLWAKLDHMCVLYVVISVRPGTALVVLRHGQ